MRPKATLASIAAAAALVLASCGSPDEAEQSPTTPAPETSASATESSTPTESASASESPSASASESESASASPSESESDSPSESPSESAEAASSPSASSESDSDSEASLDDYKAGTRGLVEELASILDQSPERTFKNLSASDEYTTSGGVLDHAAIQQRVAELTAPEEQPADNTGGGNSDSGDSAPQEQSGSDASTATVVRAVDGDTLELANGERVRVNGIDTPERGQCGYEEATNRMAAMTVGQTVTLTQYGDDRDHYGRLIRYVDVAGTDTGLVLIQEGLAIARYDSRDGYGWHPREGTYIQADAAAEDVSCQSQPAPQPTPESTPEPTPETQPAPDQGSGGGGGGNCAAGYSPCLPPSPPDLDCADVNGPIEVTGSDPHRLDRDGDGIACEWG